LSQRALEDERQTNLVEKAWKDSGRVNGYRKIHDDLSDRGKAVSENRVARLARLAGMLIHSDQGVQFTNREWAAFLHEHNLEHSMSRRGNSYDNAVAESFFQLLKREKVRRRKYRPREEARRDVFEYIEMFYNPKRKHTYNCMLSPVDYEE